MVDNWLVAVVPLLVFLVGIALYYKTVGKTFHKVRAFVFTVVYSIIVCCGTYLWTQELFVPTTVPLVLDNIVPTTVPLVLDNIPFKLQCDSEAVPVELRIVSAWVFDRSLPPDILTNIKGWNDRCSGVPIHVYCGTSQCIHAITDLNNPSITTEFLHASDLISDTPLEEWFTRHPLNKVLAQLEFELHLQKVVQLSFLWKHGGVYVDPMVRMTGEKCIAKMCHNNLSCKEQNSSLDVSCFPQQHPLIRGVAEKFVHDYPKNGSVHSAFRFDFDNVVETACKSYCKENSCCFPNVTHQYKNIAQDVSLLEGHHYGTLSYDSRNERMSDANLGDQVQGFPGIQFLPFVDYFLDRDSLSKLKTKEPVTVFFNAWWGDKRMNWPPPPNVDPIMTSIHMQREIHTQWAESIDYLKKKAPIGTRDTDTLEFMRKNNVESYFSACMTLMMNNPSKRRTDDIYLADVKKELKGLLPQEVTAKGIEVKHHVYKDFKDSLKRFTWAYKRVDMYASAKLVVTQRIHCALPCVAMGIPVIFINSQKLPGGGGSKNVSSLRLGGLTELFHTIDLYRMSKEDAKEWLHNFDWSNPPPNPNTATTMKLRATFWNVIRPKQSLYDAARKFGVIPLPHPPHDSEQGRNDQLLFHLIYTTTEESSILIVNSDLSPGGSMSGAFNWRHWRSVESIFHHHPFAKVILHSNTLSQSEFDVLTEAGYSIEVRKYDLREMLKGSPAEGFTSKLRGASKGQYWYSHETDLLRLLLLYNHGGIYMDTDVIVVKPVNSLRNVLAWEGPTHHALNGGFMTFKKGNRFMRECLVTFAKEYDGKSWGGNGPLLLTRIYNTWKNDAEVNALGHSAFYMFHWQAVQKQCFEKISDTSYNEHMKILKDQAYAVHLNSRSTGREGLESNKLPNGTFCKYLLNSFCVLCNNMH